RWLIPHFEKMLYDNALLARTYLRGWQVTGNEDLRDIARRTLDYMLRDLALGNGGLASSEDADSEGHEGTFYVWDRGEFLGATGDDGSIAAERFGVSDGGNFEGKSVLSLAVSTETVADHHGVSRREVDEAVDRASTALFDLRLQRPRPERDDKAVAAWNGLALRALAEAALVLDDAAYLEAAQKLATFLTTEMRRADGRLLRSRRQGVGSIPGFCDDYAATVLGLIALHQADGRPSWLTTAVDLADEMVDLFADADGGFHAVGRDSDHLITRPLDLMDNPVPSGNSMAAEALLIVAHLTGRDELLDIVEGALKAGGTLLESHPAAVGYLAAVAHSFSADPRELAIVGDPTDAVTQSLVAVAAARFRPDVFMARADGAEAPVAIFEGRLPATQPMAYLCRRFACEAPTADSDQLSASLGRNMPR
ncbi:MAG: thioredoxin domain-containing protein, partial [Acidimicrobiia bacterium]|nr:thioredoxin domain-containing protein [Acidimicrobiia bacterium]